MANYIVSDTNLTAVANAIRTKGGTSEQLEFPDDFVSAIGDIQTGGGSSVTVEPLSVTENGTYTAPTGKAYSPVTVNVSGGGTDELLLLEENQLTSRTTTATKIKGYCYWNLDTLTGVSFPNAITIGNYCFYDCANLETLNIPSVQSVGTYVFSNCPKLKKIDLPSVTSIGQRAFATCSGLEEVNINENFTGIIDNYVFNNCKKLAMLDLEKASSITVNAFNGCTILNVLILRKTDAICTLQNINAFTNTPFASGRAGGTLYVPQDLISSYQSANNWSTILGYANNQIKAIEGSIYE